MTATDSVDVLIVGAEPSGAVAAHTLAARGLTVLCLEQGDWITPQRHPSHDILQPLRDRVTWNWDPNKRSRWEDYPIVDGDSDIPALMMNAVGGTSIIYGAHWHRLLPHDFRVGTHGGVDHNWPLTYRDLEPFHNRVDEFIGVAGVAGDPAYPSEHAIPLPPHPIGAAGGAMALAMNRLGWHWWPGTQAIPSTAFKNMAQCVRWGLCERGCPAGAKASFDLAYWPHATAAGARLQTSARVCRITATGRGFVDGAIWADPAGTHHRVKANAVVLAANGIGTPRLMLMSDDMDGAGLGNSSGLLGKNLMMHPIRSVVGAYDADMETWHGPAGQLIYSLQFYGTNEARGFVGGAKWSLVPIPGVLAALDLFDELPFEQRWGRGAHALSRYAGKVLSWAATVDDLPEEGNHVTLDPVVVDDSGLPAARINYHISENSHRNLAFSADRMREAHVAGGAVKTVTSGTIASGHLLGTARMGKDPTHSVVDPFGRSHDIPNLFIVDGSVMVTGGGVNPTATITALALRSAEHLAHTARTMPAQL